MAAKKPLVTGASPAVVRQIDNADHLDVPGGAVLGTPLGAASGGLGVNASGWASGKVPRFNGSTFVAGDAAAVPSGADGEVVYIGSGQLVSQSSFTWDGVSIQMNGAYFSGEQTFLYRTAGIACDSPLSSVSSSFQLQAHNSAGASAEITVGSKDLFLHSSGSFEWDGHAVWHAGNDGAASGLDADLLDGQHGSYYLAATNLTGTVSVANGGTGQTTLALARNAMGLGNTTGALPVANGGTGGTTQATARSGLGLGTAATYNVPASGNAGASEVVLGNDSRLGGGSPPGSNTQVIYNSSGSFAASANMTFDGTAFRSVQAQARLIDQTQNANLTLNSTNFPQLNRVIKKTSTGNYTYTIANTLGADGDTLTVVNASTSGNITVVGSGVTLYSAGTSVANIVLGPRQMMTLYRMSSTAWIR